MYIIPSANTIELYPIVKIIINNKAPWPYLYDRHN